MRDATLYTMTNRLRSETRLARITVGYVNVTDTPIVVLITRLSILSLTTTTEEAVDSVLTVRITPWDGDVTSALLFTSGRLGKVYTPRTCAAHVIVTCPGWTGASSAAPG